MEMGGKLQASTTLLLSLEQVAQQVLMLVWKMCCLPKIDSLSSGSPPCSFPITGLDRPLGFQEVGAPRISRQSAHEGGKVVSPTHRPSLPPGRILDTHLLEAESTPGSQCDRKD
jgi:hypothetical protein